MGESCCGGQPDRFAACALTPQPDDSERWQALRASSGCMNGIYGISGQFCVAARVPKVGTAAYDNVHVCLPCHAQHVHAESLCLSGTVILRFGLFQRRAAGSPCLRLTLHDCWRDRAQSHSCCSCLLPQVRRAMSLVPPSDDSACHCSAMIDLATACARKMLSTPRL